MERETKIMTDEIFQGIYTSEKLRNDVAFANPRILANGQRDRVTSTYPVNYIVTDEQIKKANELRLEAKLKALESLGNKLVFVGMGGSYSTENVDFLEMTDDIGNHRIRTEFINKKGVKYFVKFSKGGYNRREKVTSKSLLRVDHAINRTRQVELNDDHHQQREFFNCFDLESNTPLHNYTKKSILHIVNKYFGCAFEVIEIDTTNLRPEDFVCVSPKGKV